MSEENTIAAGEFKAKCLKIMAGIERTSQSLVITKRGKPLVRIVPYIAEDAPESAFGCMKDSAILEDATATASHEILNETILQKEEPEIVVGSKPIEAIENDTTSHELQDFLDTSESLAENSTNTPEAELPGEIAENKMPEGKGSLKDSSKISEIEPDMDTVSLSETQEEGKEARKPLPILRTAPPNRGLPTEPPLYQQREPAEPQMTVSPSSSDSFTNIRAENNEEHAEDNELYIPSLSGDTPMAETDEFDEVNINANDGIFFNTADDEDEDNFFFLDDDEDGLEILETAEEENELPYSAQESEGNTTSPPSPATASEDIKQKLAQQFTSAWNRNPNNGENT